MNFGVIGEPCVDCIHKPGSEMRKCLGGILYSVVSLAVLSGNRHSVYPIMYLGTDEFDNITSFLSRFENIKTDFIFRCGQKIRVVNLYYRTYIKDNLESAQSGKTYDREESSTEPVPPLEFGKLEQALPGLDALLINMVSGVDLTLDTLKKISGNFTNYTHIDLHNIVMRMEPDGTRIQQAAVDWEEWCTQCETIQMNELELAAMTGGTLKEYEAAEKILSSGNELRTKAMLVTRGREGVSLYQKKEKTVMNEKYTGIDRADIPAVERPNFRDATGCGDVFASAFFFKNAAGKGKDYPKALKFANRIAGIKTEFTGVEELHNLSSLVSSFEGGKRDTARRI